MHRTNSFSRGSVFTLILVNCAVYLLQILGSSQNSIDYVSGYGALIPANVLSGEVWRIFSYMFLHDTRSIGHLLFNMYTLFICGMALESVWGSRKFLVYYLFCGVGAGISIVIVNSIIYGTGYYGATIGASGAVYGVLLAFGLLFPEAEFLVFFIIPMKARVMVIILIGISLYFLLTGKADGISHIGHLGGFVFGIIYFLLIERRKNISWKMKMAAGKSESQIPKAETVGNVNAKNDESTEMKKSIIQKLTADGGTDTLTDDEYQFVKYLDIMTDEGKNENKRSIDLTDDFISDRQFLETVKKYISL
jgi:membrane associated rhomboid family serine protease